jgi:putative MFS transporter
VHAKNLARDERTSSSRKPSLHTSILNSAVIVSALGYFVDIYDLLLFSIVRVTSLKSIGVPEEALLSQGIHLINMQMLGLLTGGILWGVWGDKRGRLSVLFGSILLYSLGNIANAFVSSVEMYAWLRFITGVGLAGELGAAITLITEVMTKEHRGYGTAVVAGFGILGGVFAGSLAEHFSWQTCYLIGGGMGLVLLVLRISVRESPMFKQIKTRAVRRGDLLLLLGSRERLSRYLCCVLTGLPIWFAIGVLMTFAPELAVALKVLEPVSAGKAVMYCYGGSAAGDFLAGLWSQHLKSRKKVISRSIVATFICTLIYVSSSQIHAQSFYYLCIAFGLSVGYWSVFVTTAAEQFGTNLRATVATTAPNVVRGSVVVITSVFQLLIPLAGLLNSALIVGCLCCLIALLALRTLPESYGREMEFIEE